MTATIAPGSTSTRIESNTSLRIPGLIGPNGMPRTTDGLAEALSSGNESRVESLSFRTTELPGVITMDIMIRSQSFGQSQEITDDMVNRVRDFVVRQLGEDAKSFQVLDMGFRPGR